MQERAAVHEDPLQPKEIGPETPAPNLQASFSLMRADLPLR